MSIYIIILAYDDLRVPPRIDWAQRHGKASMIGTPKHISSNEQRKRVICPCCSKTSVNSFFFKY